MIDQSTDRSVNRLIEAFHISTSDPPTPIRPSVYCILYHKKRTFQILTALYFHSQQLRCQIDTDAQDKEALMREKVRLQDLIQQLQTKVSDLEGRVCVRARKHILIIT